MIRMDQKKRGSLPSKKSKVGSERNERRAALANDIAGIVLQEGLGDLGLRGLAARMGTSDRMLLYYFETKDQLVIDVLDQVGVRLSILLARNSAGPPVSPGEFLAGVMTLARDPAVAPFMRLWTEVISRGARGERPYNQVAAKVVRSWLAWIDSRLTPPASGSGSERAAAILSLVEGTTLLELACPGSTTGVQPYLSAALDTCSSVP